MIKTISYKNIKKNTTKLTRYCSLLLLSMLIVACSSSTVYRSETTSGITIYSKDKPKLNKGTGYYEITDLDGNLTQVRENLLLKSEEYKRPEK